jgi:hypothetical protein
MALERDGYRDFEGFVREVLLLSVGAEIERLRAASS